MIPVISNNKSVECDELVITTLKVEIRNEAHAGSIISHGFPQVGAILRILGTSHNFQIFD